jgi:hypothetical protein
MSESNEQRLHALAREVAAHLGFEWAYAAGQAESHLACFDGPDGSTMVLHFDGYGSKQRLAVRGRYPQSVQTRHGYVSFHPRDDAPHVTFSLTRLPHHVAKDILRRFVPAYLAAYEKAVAQRQRCLQVQTNEREGNRRLAEALGLTAANDGSVRFYRSPLDPGNGPTVFGHLETSLYGGAPNVKMELHGIPFETALEIAALLAPLTKRGER